MTRVVNSTLLQSREVEELSLCALIIFCSAIVYGFVEDTTPGGTARLLWSMPCSSLDLSPKACRAA